LTAGVLAEIVVLEIPAKLRQEDATVTPRHLIAVTITGLSMLSTPTAGGQSTPNRFPDLGPSSAPPVATATAEPGTLRLDSEHTQATLNQRTADAIAAHLRDSGQLRRYSIDIRFQNGVAILIGRVANDAQRQTAISLAGTVPGVETVREQLLVENRTALMPAQALDPFQLPEQAPAPRPIPVPMCPPSYGQAPQAGMGAGPAHQEPEPIFKAGQPDMMMQPPLLPPYAWPTYAPFNNYSRVAYPTQYPYEAFPFIGPFYPFPKVPLGWRSVSLTWEDGYWWYGRNATGHDWWRIRYW